MKMDDGIDTSADDCLDKFYERKGELLVPLFTKFAGWVALNAKPPVKVALRTAEPIGIVAKHVGRKLLEDNKNTAVAKKLCEFSPVFFCHITHTLYELRDRLAIKYYEQNGMRGDFSVLDWHGKGSKTLHYHYKGQRMESWYLHNYNENEWREEFTHGFFETMKEEVCNKETPEQESIAKTMDNAGLLAEQVCGKLPNRYASIEGIRRKYLIFGKVVPNLKYSSDLEVEGNASLAVGLRKGISKYYDKIEFSKNEILADKKFEKYADIILPNIDKCNDKSQEDILRECEEIFKAR